MPDQFPIAHIIQFGRSDDKIWFGLTTQILHGSNTIRNRHHFVVAFENGLNEEAYSFITVNDQNFFSHAMRF
jgi:hypothetical protein